MYINTMTRVLLIFTLVVVIVLAAVDWHVDGFILTQPQDYKFFFQFWVSVAGLVFTLIMALTIFILYHKSKLPSLKFIALSFFFLAFAFIFIGYHSSYCKLCSDLAMCSASHNYSSSFIVIALILSVLILLLNHLKNNISILRFFSYGLIIASFLMLIVLFISIRFMEVPGFVFYTLGMINLQGFVFVFPLIIIVLSYIYFKRSGHANRSILFILSLLFLSFVPQAYHIFVCTDCDTMECSEFFITSGLFMFISTVMLLYAMILQLQETK